MAKNTEDVTTRLKMEKGRQFRRDADAAGKSVRGIGKQSEAAAARMKLLNGANDRINRGFTVMRRAATTAGIALAGIGALGVKASIQNASDLNEEVNKTNVIFGKAAGRIQQFAADSAKALGMSKREAFGFAGQIGGLFKSAGNSAGDAAKLSTKIVGLSSDLASFFNTDPSDAFDALRSGLSGEVEPMRRYNVFLNENAVKQEAMRLGLVKGSAKLTDQQKIMARYSLIMKQTGDAQGDFARTSNGLANQQRILRAQLTNLSAKLGKALLPLMTKGANALSKFIDQFDKGRGAGGRFRDKLVEVGNYLKDDLFPKVKAVVLAVYGFIRSLNLSKGSVTAILGVLVGFVVLVKLVKMVLAVQRAWTLLNLAFTASPVGLIITGLALLAVGFAVAYQKVGWFHRAVDSVFGFVRKNWPTILPILTGPIGAATVLIVRHFDQIVGFVKKLPGRIARAASGLWNGLKSGLAAALNWVIGKINGLIGAYNDTLGRIPGAPDIGELSPVGGGGGQSMIDANTAASNNPGIPQPKAPSRRGGGGHARAAAAGAGGSSVHVYLDSDEVGHRMLKKSRDRARRR